MNQFLNKQFVTMINIYDETWTFDPNEIIMFNEDLKEPVSVNVKFSNQKTIMFKMTKEEFIKQIKEQLDGRS